MRQSDPLPTIVEPVPYKDQPSGNILTKAGTKMPQMNCHAGAGQGVKRSPDY